MESIQDKVKHAKFGAYLSIFTYLILTVFKLIYGYIFHSNALIADGLNNSTDIISSIAILIGLSISIKPADKIHNYGHYRAEFVASLLASFIMFAVSVQVLIDGITSFINDTHQVPNINASVIALISGIIMLIVSFINRHIAKKTSSTALKAASYDNLSDALVSFGAAIGIIGVSLGFYILDTIAALVIGLIIMKTSLGIFKESTITLTDGFDHDELQKMHQLVDSHKDVYHVKDIKARSHGMVTFIDVTVTVDPHLNVTESHYITEQIETILIDYYQNVETIVHIEPEY